MLNETHTPDNLRIVASYPTTPASGGVVIYGDLCGVAEGDEDSDGYTVTRFGPWVGDLSVTDINTGGIAVGAPLFASKANPVVLSNLATGVFFGWANEVVGDGLTATIEVIKAGYAGGVLAAGAIGTTQLAADAVTGAKVADDAIDSEHIAAGAIDNEHIATGTIANAKLDSDNVKVAEVALTAGAANAFAFAWQNPESAAILITRVIVDLTTAGGTATAVLDVGTAADATTHSDNLIDGVDLNAAAIYDNVLAADAGTHGKPSQKLDENGGTTDYITGQILTEAASALVGNAYIFYREV